MIEEKPRINENPNWRVNSIERLSACDNRPGLKKIYITVLDIKGEPMPNIKVRFDTESSHGIAYDHPFIWGLTNERNGYLEWNHLGIPTRYLLWMEEDATPLIENIKTDLGYEYCKPGSWPFSVGGWRPINRPGIYSYRIVIQKI